MERRRFILKFNSKAATPQKIERLGKDEMNLVEHPFALLKRSAETVLHLEWEKTHPRTGKSLKASWRVEGSGELGLPGPTEERLYLVMMELSREQGWPQKVVFSRHDVLLRLGLCRSAANYAAIHESFLRLTAVIIDAKRSFWKADAQDFAASLQFHILEEVEIIDEAPGRRKGQIPLALSSFTWSRVLHQSLIAGNVRSFPLDFALSLDLPLSARLFRYLDKHRTGDTQNIRHKFEIELHRLCEIHLGMTSAKYASKLKERLLPALQELRARGFLTEFAFEPMKSAPGTEKAVFYFGNGALFNGDRKTLAQALAPSPSTAPVGVLTVGALPTVLNMVSGVDENSAEDFSDLDEACDRVFAALDADVRDKINARARETLPPFLQQTMSAPGAVRGMEKERRASVWSEHKSAVYAVLSGEPAETPQTVEATA